MTAVKRLPSIDTNGMLIAGVFALTGAFLPACGDTAVESDPPEEPVVTSVEVSPSTATINAGVSLQLQATVRDQAGNEMDDETITWTSSDPTVATVSSLGTVQGIAVGQVEISAKAAGETGTASVTVLTDDQMTSLELSFSSYAGGSGAEQIRDIAVDADGNIYITGNTVSSDFPVTAGAYDVTFDASGSPISDALVTKLDPNGSVIWSTFLGGPNFERAYAIEVDDQGYVYIAGRAGDGLPVTSNAFQTTFHGGTEAQIYGPQDGFLCKLTPDGSDLVFCSYFGTSDPNIVRDLDIDGNGDIYIAASASSGSFPSSWFANAYQPTRRGGRDVVVAKIASDGSRVIWATYLGGSGDESDGNSIRVGPGGSVYVLTSTRSADLPTPNGFDGTLGGSRDFYLAKIAPDGSDLIFGTYLGGSEDEGTETHELAVDEQGNAYVAAATSSTDFPITEGVFQTKPGGSGRPDAFVAKISPDGSELLASTFVGGSEGDWAEGVAVDEFGNVYFSGGTQSDDFPSTTGASRVGDVDAVVVKLSPDLRMLLHSTVLGGAASDAGRAAAARAGSFFMAGQTESLDWPTLNPLQSNYRGETDGVVVGFRPAN